MEPRVNRYLANVNELKYPVPIDANTVYCPKAANFNFYLSTYFKGFINLFLEKGSEGEKEREKHQCVVACCTPPTRDLAHNPGMGPDWEPNQ